MNSHFQKRRLFIISLDGLSTEEFEILSHFCPSLAELSCLGAMVRLDTGKVTTAQPVWAEILTGKRWHELGCTGYARPHRSLNEMEILSEYKLPCKISLLGFDSQGVDLIINMPLLMPEAGRIWLSDGSLPVQLAVSPQDLAASPPFSSYRARAYPASSAALRDRNASARDALALEENRLACALELIENERWNTCLLRISIFDLLAHVFGSEYLSEENLLVREDIVQFFSRFDHFIGRILKLIPDSEFCLASAYSHMPCLARVNLNQLLIRGGFCSISKDSGLVKRREAALSIAAAGGTDLRETGSMVSGGYRFDLKKTTACSPAGGAVYLNRKARFAEGIVETDRAEAAIKEVREFLQHELAEEFGDQLSFVRYEPEVREAPDLMIYLQAVDFHDSGERIVIDRHSTPRSVHKAEGFVLLKDTGGRKSISPVELHSILKERVS